MKLFILTDKKGYIISSTRERILKEQIEVEMTDESETLNYKYVDGELLELTPEEKEKLYHTINIEKSKQEEQLNQMMLASMRNSFLIELPDEEAKDIPLCFGSWDSFSDGYGFIEGTRVEYKGGLWKCKKGHKKQASWYPGAEPTLWEQLDKENHDGTELDPIPVPDSVTTSGFTYTYGKYYLENGVTYLCKRGGIPDEQAEAMYGQKETLYFPPSALIGQYFVSTIKATALSMSNQYTYTFGEYYDDEGVKYICKDVNALNPTESYGETFTSKFKPKYLVGRYFEVVKNDKN